MSIGHEKMASLKLKFQNLNEGVTQTCGLHHYCDE